MPNISSDTLFHFSSTIENVKGILKNGFYPRYSLECLDFEGKNKAEFAYAMVCFCDIPLSHVKEHLETYGNYGIGMSREWVVSQRLNPVLYLRKGSELSNCMYFILNNVKDTSAAKDPIARNIKAGLLFTLRHLKPFEGISYRTGKMTKFYNEREWRYVPFIFPDENGKQILIDQLEKKDYQNAVLIKERNLFLEKFKLGFDPKDIKYIIVENEQAISEIVDYLHAVHPEHDETTIRILTSRIITSEQIKKDF